jgi:hypothetical protein
LRAETLVTYLGVNNLRDTRNRRGERLTGQLVTVGWQDKMVTVVVVLSVSTKVDQAPVLRARAPRATMRVETRIVDADDEGFELVFLRVLGGEHDAIMT